jgi:hypothetical protein
VWKSALVVGLVAASGAGVVGRAAVAEQQPNPRQQPGAMISMYAPEQHDLYDGHYVLSASRIYMIGGLKDPVGWDHMDNEAKSVKPVSGTAEIDVNDLTNTGKFEARLKIAEGDLVLTIDKFNEFNPCQNGGIVGFLHEHGTDSGCGDNNWPKTFVYLAGWGFGHATLNGKPLYENYEMHFMVTQGIRDRKTLRVNYPMANKKQPAGEVNPATQQIDFYIRSPQQNPKNKPNREVFMHLSGWRSPGSRDLPDRHAVCEMWLSRQRRPVKARLCRHTRKPPAGVVVRPGRAHHAAVAGSRPRNVDPLAGWCSQAPS